jgi:predicted esterase
MRRDQVSPRYMRVLQRVLSVMALFALAVAPARAALPLTDLAAGLNIDKQEISVSGISSGAFMAHQFHVAHSEHIMGAGIIAGGPYYCAQGSILDAVTKCSKFVDLTCQKLVAMVGGDTNRCQGADRTPQDESQIKQMAQESFNEAKKRNTLGNIKTDRVYLFSGRYDAIVPHGVMDAVYDLYTDPDKLGLSKKNVEYNREFPARHTVVRDSFNRPEGKVVGDCILPPNPPPPTDENSFIDDCQGVALAEMKENSCICPTDAGADCPPADSKELCTDVEDVDLAGAILKHIYGKKALASERVPTDEDEVLPFDQRRIFATFFPTGWRVQAQNASMAKQGYIYIPKSCREGKKCKLHVAFHGCLQGGKTDLRPGHSGNLFSKFAGYNEWAEANDIVVLYPQVEGRQVPPPLNPQGCWDWWGQDYTHGNYHTKSGSQIRAVAEMINVLVGREQLLDVSAE